MKTYAARLVPMTGVGPRKDVPVTILNVKPYWVVLRGTKILCDGEHELPVVFDTQALALFCIKDNGLENCEVKEMELEQLARKCRDRKVPFDSVILIDRWSQLGVD